jgi:ribose 1,5-bisphosphokinase PhnN
MSSGILFVIGASGAGKTAAVTELAARPSSAARCFYFDSIGVPSHEAMVREFGSGEQWQAHATRQWVDQLVADGYNDVAVRDGQTCPSFITAATAGAGSVCTNIVLLDCSPDVRATRLAVRGQPELASSQMTSWAAYLRGQADALGLAVVNTSALTIAEVADALEQQVARLRTAVAGAT